MSCPDPICRLVQCVVTDDIPSYLGDYSLQTGSQFVNLEMSIPAGGGFYIVAPGTIVINVPPNPQFISYQGCKSMVNETVPPGATPAQILQIVSDVMSQVGTQLSLCNAPAPTGNPAVVGSFTNGLVSAGCGGDMLANLVGTLPRYVSFSITGLTIQGGIFSSGISQEDADNQASIFLDSLFDSEVQCGWYNTQQQAVCCDMTTQTVAADTIFSTVSQADADAQALAQATAACPTCYWNTEQQFTCTDHSVQTVPAHTYMSIISQADADATALAAAEAMCPAADCAGAIQSLTWTPVSVDPTGNNFCIITGNNINASADGGLSAGSVTVSTSITNGNSSDCVYKFVGTVTVQTVTSTSFFKINATTLYSGNAILQPVDFVFTVPAMSTLAVSMELFAGTGGGTTSANVTLQVGP